MPTLFRYVPQFYRDSVSLMQFSRGWKLRPGVEEATAIMATPANLALLVEAGFVDETPAPRPDDLLLVLRGDGVTEAVLDDAEAELKTPAAVRGAVGAAGVEPASVGEAVRLQPDLNFALISVPGDYAAAEALKALARGLSVMLFSDNVSVEREVFLKKEAARRGLLLLGPDCGTAIVNGAPLGFANAVRRGPVGIVSASGTGLQEVSCLIDRWGSGVSQALGVGGRDLKDAVGGLATLACLAVLAADPATRAVLLVGKPPGPATKGKVLRALHALGKPFVTCFLGDEGAPSLAEAARAAFVLAEDREPEASDPAGLPAVSAVPPSGGRFLRGLYSGGTLCAEAASMAARRLSSVTANVAVPGVRPLDSLWKSSGHCLIDLGEDEFTRGKPHPMIDPSLRWERLGRELDDAETAVVLLDLVLGFGAHPDPAGDLTAFLAARSGGRQVPVVVSVTGTDADPQGWSRSLTLLRNAGIEAYGSHETAVRAALSKIPQEAV